MSELAIRHSNGVAEYETEFRQVDPTGGRLIAWADSLAAAHRLATALCETSFVPKHFAGKPIEAAAALLLGDELGLSPVSALRSIFVISGTPGLYAKAMVALVLSHGHELWTEKDTADEVTVCGRRKGTTNVERSSWTTARARKAGYTNNKKYETDPQAMLYARAASDVCRKVAADVLAGVPHAVEELELEAAPKRAGSTVKRATTQAPEPDLEPTVTAEQIPNDPGAITPDQVKKMATVMGKLGLTERASALAYVADVIGHDVESRNNLTRAEASAVIDSLERDDRGEAPEPSLDIDPANPGFGDRA